jgi:hypothetical protein
MRPGRLAARTRAAAPGGGGWLLAASAALVVASGTVVGAALLDEPAQPSRQDRAVDAPTSPPARVCGDHDLLDGPETPPAGAVRVRPGQDLSQLTRDRPAGTTFWLASGRHVLPLGEFASVIAKDGNTYVGAPGAVLDGRRTSRYAFTGEAVDVTIEHLTVVGFGVPGSNNDAGVVNHDAGRGWTIRATTVRGNAGAGVVLGTDNRLVDSCLEENGQYGFNVYHPSGVRNVTLEHNEITGNNTDNWETRRPGGGGRGGGRCWDVLGATVVGNWVHHNHGAGLWADTNNAGFLVAGNYIEANDAEGMVYETSYNASIRDNTFVRNAIVAGPKNPGFPTPALFISESGSDPRVPGPFGERFLVSGNVFRDNWSGVVLWENADRFAGSSTNTSTGAGTLVNTGVVRAETCTADTIREDPYFDDCRWKTQNVHVTRNLFSYAPKRVGPDCRPAAGCGYNGLFSNWGSWPPWSPYHGDVVERQITFEQQNLFEDNTYVGPWRFVAEEQGNVVTLEAWQDDPYGQDTTSVVR